LFAGRNGRIPSAFKGEKWTTEREKSGVLPPNLETKYSTKGTASLGEKRKGETEDGHEKKIPGRRCV